jgi:hypothetical protein
MLFMRTIKVFLAIVLILLSLALALILFVDWQRAAPLAIVLAALFAAYKSLSAAIERRRALGLARTAEPQAALTAELADEPPIACYSLTRGTGTLHLDGKGSLQFHADPVLSGWCWPPKAVRRLSQVERSLTIPRDQVRVAVPFDHLGSGPSVVVGYHAANNGLCWEEFILATPPKGSSSFPQPTGDALIWAQVLGPGAVPAELGHEATSYRRRIHRRLSLTLWGVTTAAITGALVLVFGLMTLVFALTGNGDILLPILAAASAIWLAAVLISGGIILAVIR